LLSVEGVLRDMSPNLKNRKLEDRKEMIRILLAFVVMGIIFGSC
jgi:hypothetical protein